MTRKRIRKMKPTPGKRLRALMEGNKLTIQQLALDCGVGKRSLEGYLADERPAGLNNLRKLAAYFKVELGALLWSGN